MASGINIDIAANVRDFQRGTKDVERALDDVGGRLDDLARDTARSSERAGDALGDGITDGAKEGERSVEQLETSFRELARGVQRESSAAGKDLGTNVRRGTDDAKEGLGEFRDEANSTARESAASFDGSFESVADSIQEIAANAFAGFGPAGAVAGLAAAAGIGIVMSKMEEGQETTEKFKERVGELTQELIDVGDAEVSLEYVVDKLKEMATASDDAEVSLTDLNTIAEKSGASYEDLAAAYAGAGGDLDKLIEKTKEQKRALEESNAAEDAGLAYRDRVGGDDPRIDATQKYIDFLQQAKDAQDEAAENERLYAEANGPELAAKAELIGNIDKAYDDAAGSADDFLDKETGLFDVQGFIDSMTQRKQSLIEYQETLATSALTPAAKAFISSQGVESAATFMAGYKTATPAQQAELNRIWSEAGTTSSGAFSSSTQANLDQAGYNAGVTLNPIDQKLRDYVARTSLSMGVTLRVADGSYGAGLGFIKRQP
jgi:hypothetical protein